MIEKGGMLSKIFQKKENKSKKKKKKQQRPGLDFRVFLQLGWLVRRHFAGRRRVVFGNALLDLLLLVGHTVLGGLLFDFFLGKLGQLVGGTDVGDVLGVTLCEDDIDLFQSATGGFRVKEPDGRNEETVPGGEEEVSTPTNAVNHDRSDHDNSKVEEPVTAGGHGVGLRTGLDGRQLSGVEPRQRQPGGTEEAHVHEETENSTLGDLGITLSHGGTGDQASEHDDHGGALSETATKEKLATTNFFDKEPREGSEDSVANHVNTTDQKSEIVALSNGLLKQDREIVNDSVATRNLLEELGRRTDNHTTEVLRRATSEKVAERRLGSTGGSNRVNDKVLLHLGLAVINLNTVQTSQNGFTLRDTVVGDEPARRLGHVVHADNDDNSKDNLEGDGETPHKILGTIVGTKVNPVGNHGSDGNDTTLNTDQETTILGVRTLSLVRRDGGSVHAVANTSDDTANDELGQLDVTLDGGDLDNNTDNHDSSTPNNHPATTHPVTKNKCKNSTQQAANLIHRSNRSLHDIVVLGGPEHVVERGVRNDTGHDTLCVESVSIVSTHHHDEYTA